MKAGRKNKEGMSASGNTQRRLKLSDGGKMGVRTQFGALCWRRSGDEIEVLLVTSRRRKRWIVPKGWPEDRMTPAKTALTEAWEEAGVEGKAKPVCLGIYSYEKELLRGKSVPCVVAVFPVRVKKLRRRYPEAKERRRKWFTPEKAAKKVDEPELAALLESFDPANI